MKPSPFAPTAVTCTPLPSPGHSLIGGSARRSALVFNPPHRPLSVVMTIRPTFFTASRLTRKGLLYSGFALERWPAICQMRLTYGRVWRMRSCAFFIFDAATISIALVILRVLCTLLILLRISLVPAMRICFAGFPRPPLDAGVEHD